MIISFKGNIWETPSYSYARKQFFPISSKVKTNKSDRSCSSLFTMDGLKTKSVKGTKFIGYILGTGFGCYQIYLVIWASWVKNNYRNLKTNAILMFCPFWATSDRISLRKNVKAQNSFKIKLQSDFRRLEASYHHMCL